MKMKLLPNVRNAVLATVITVHACIAPASAATPAELLEKGIYTEETKGDVEGAIAIYQQLVDETKASQSLAAQAQFRLAQCLLKKKRQHEAMAAFEKLIRDYPAEKELVAKAREHLPATLALLPVPWVDGERLHMKLMLPSGHDIGALELRADLSEHDGRKVWRVGRRMGGSGQMLSRVDVDAETFQPVASYWKHTLLGTVSAVFKPGEVEMRREGSDEPFTARPDKAVFDNEQMMHMLRRLPLEVGYKTVIPVITTLGGGMVLPIGIDVTKAEAVETPAGTFECFKVALDVGQNFWVAKDPHRYLVKFDGGGAIAHLTSVTQRAPGALLQFHDEKLGVSLTAPPDWVAHAARKDDGETMIHLLDPLANAEYAGLKLEPTSSLPEPARQSARARAEQDQKDTFAKHFGKVTVRENSWRDFNVAGRHGVGFVADFTQNEKPKVIFTVYALGPQLSEQLILICAPEALEPLQSAMEQILASYRLRKN